MNTIESAVHRKRTITVDEEVYQGLHRVVGRGSISRFVSDLVRPHVVSPDLDAAYKSMARDERREEEALAWAEAVIGDVSDEAR